MPRARAFSTTVVDATRMAFSSNPNSLFDERATGPARSRGCMAKRRTTRGLQEFRVTLRTET
eukprot:5461557-Pyramimonas_sp.AAC.1